jgi:RNA polymerase sigma-70 factor (ECF subfamily)
MKQKLTRDTITELYERYRKPVYAYIRKHTRDGEVARDLSQEVYVRLLAIDEINESDRPQSLLYRIALNLVIDWSRARRVRSDYATYAFQEDRALAADFQNVERIALAQEGVEVLSAAIADLPPKCRRVFVLHRIHNLSYKEIGEKLGLSSRAIEKHIERGMQRVKEEFERAFDESARSQPVRERRADEDGT